MEVPFIGFRTSSFPPSLLLLHLGHLSFPSSSSSCHDWAVSQARMQLTTRSVLLTTTVVTLVLNFLSEPTPLSLSLSLSLSLPLSHAFWPQSNRDWRPRVAPPVCQSAHPLCAFCNQSQQSRHPIHQWGSAPFRTLLPSVTHSKHLPLMPVVTCLWRRWWRATVWIKTSSKSKHPPHGIRLTLLRINVCSYVFFFSFF